MQRYMIKMPHTHLCVIGLYFHGGSIIENKEIKGISHLLEHLIFRRLDCLPQEDLYHELNKIGFNLHDFTSDELIGFYIQTTSEKADKAI